MSPFQEIAGTGGESKGGGKEMIFLGLIAPGGVSVSTGAKGGGLRFTQMYCCFKQKRENKKEGYESLTSCTRGQKKGSGRVLIRGVQEDKNGALWVVGRSP